MKQIFLSGGGDALDSALLDDKFVTRLRAGGTLIYIPVAEDEDKYDSCRIWFQSAFRPKWTGEIETLIDLMQKRNLDEVSGIYLGGGDASRLLHTLVSSGYDSYLREACARGIPIYGGSAGAIVLGACIRTAPEARHLQTDSAKGIDLLSGCSVYCHFTEHDKDTVLELQRKFGHPIIALTEKSGALLEDASAFSYGTRAAIIFSNDGATLLESGN